MMQIVVQNRQTDVLCVKFEKISSSTRTDISNEYTQEPTAHCGLSVRMNNKTIDSESGILDPNRPSEQMWWDVLHSD